MKKLISFPVVIIIMWVITIILICVKVEDESAKFASSVVTLPVYLAILSTYAHFKSEGESRKNPIHFSYNEVGEIFRVKEMNNNIIGLVHWGYRDYALQDADEPQTFYFVSDIPVHLRSINSIFRVARQGDKLAFQEIKINGFSDKTKKPFEVLPQLYCV